jgi:hypothetical protein
MRSDEEVRMDRSTFKAADLIVVEIADKLDELLGSDQFAAIRVLLARLREPAGWCGAKT